VSNNVATLTTTTRRASLQRLADRVLEAADLPAIARCLTLELRDALAARAATLLVWDRRLESFETVALDESGRIRRNRAPAAEPGAPTPRWLLSDGELLETPGHTGDGILVPLLARSGVAGTLVLTAPTARRRPVTQSEAALVSLIAARAAIALENHAYQHELIASERLAALGTMAGMLAHDFRGPMTVIRGYAETLLEPGVAEREVRQRAALIVEAADRLERMTTETLDFARGAERLVLRPVSVGVLLEEVAATIEQELPGLTVVRDIRVPAGQRAALDVDKLRRAVSNIAGNARQAMGGAGLLTLSARVAPAQDEGPPEWLLVELADEGPGVPPEIRERVFEPFVTLGKKHGTGLGLAVARRFVEDHGGRLELLPDQPPPLHGARFRLTLPIDASGDDGAAR
jgi:signal transduction histidine kinase